MLSSLSFSSEVNLSKVFFICGLLDGGGDFFTLHNLCSGQVGQLKSFLLNVEFVLITVPRSWLPLCDWLLIRMTGWLASNNCLSLSVYGASYRHMQSVGRLFKVRLNWFVVVINLNFFGDVDIKNILFRHNSFFLLWKYASLKKKKR